MGKRKPPHDEDPGMDFSRTMAGISETLRRAGYRLENERDLNLGMMAYNAAAMIKLVILRGQENGQGPFRETKRNDPCPCGSGKKFKKCCLSRKDIAQKVSWKPEPGPGVEPELLPNLTDMDSVRRDMEVLAGLFERDPELRKVRFSRAKATGFAEKALAEAPAGTTASPDRVNAYIDEVAHRYVKEVEGKDMLENLTDKLIEAARRATGPEDIRSIVLGIFYCSTIKTTLDAPNPLECMLFRMSMIEHMDSLGSLDRIIERLGPKEELTQRLLRGDPELRRELDEFAKNLDPIAIDAMKESFDDNMEKISGIIKQGKFPVPFPMATIFPALAKLRRADRGGKLDGPLFQKIVEETLDGLDQEDLQLYGGFLDDWIRSDDGSDGTVTAMVRLVRGMAAGGNLRPLDWDLLIVTLRNMKFSLMEGEEKVLGRIKQDPFDREFLDRYGDFIEGRGFPALGRRIRRLAVLQEQLAIPLAENRKERSRKKKSRARGG